MTPRSTSTNVVALPSRPSNRQLALVREFQPDALAIAERPPARLAHLTLYCILLTLAAGILWASLTRIDEIAIAPGHLVSVEPNVVVQPVETAIIRKIAVKVGDTVKAGQVLALLDPTVTEADIAQLSTRFEMANATVARLEAEIKGVPYLPQAPDQPSQALEARVFAQRALYRANQEKNFEEEIARAQSSMARARDERALLVSRLTGIREIETMRETLLASQTGSRLNLLQARDARLEIEASLARLTGSIVETEHELGKTRAQREAFLADFQRTTLEALSENRAKRQAAAEELKKASLRRTLVRLTAPVDGTVLELAQRSVGSVLREAEPMAVLVPAGSALEAEVMIDPKDIGHLAPGQTARLKFDTFPFQRHGTLSGTVRTISQDAFASSSRDTQQSTNPTMSFRARIAFSQDGLRDLPQGFRFTSGMSLQSEIRVGERTVISYLLYPMTRAFDEGLRER